MASSGDRCLCLSKMAAWQEIRGTFQSSFSSYRSVAIGKVCLVEHSQLLVDVPRFRSSSVNMSLLEKFGQPLSS